MKKQKKWILVLAIISIFVCTRFFLPTLVDAGNLEPSEPPDSTMHTLEEIHNKIDSAACEKAFVEKTGQVTSYAADDDGALKKGFEWPVPRFTDNVNGTVTDHLTGLVWMKEANLYESTNWGGALLNCANCNVGDYDDWHLPNVKELSSLIDYSKSWPVLPDGHPFTNLQSDWYWSSTTDWSCENAVWLVNLGSGNMNADFKSGNGCVWCVRGGQ